MWGLNDVINNDLRAYNGNMDGHLCHSPFGAIKNEAIMSIHVQVFTNVCFNFYWINRIGIARS